MSSLESSSSSSSSSSTGTISEDLLHRALGYVPVQGLSITAMILFGIFFFILSYQAYRSSQYKYLLWLPLAAFGEFIGYLFRYLVVNNESLINFILFTLFLLVIPNILALVNYSTVGRILHLIPAKSSNQVTYFRIPIITDSTGQFIGSRIALFFVFGDFLSFFIQSASSAFLTSSDPTQVKLGENIIICGLIIACIFISTFFFITLYIFYSSRYSLINHPNYHILKKIFFSLIVTITLLSIRCIYRLIEFSIGSTGYVSTHEAFLYVFDTIPILTSLLFYSLYPFGQLLSEVENTPVLPLPIIFVSNNVM